MNFYQDLIVANILNNYSNCQEIEAQDKLVSQRPLIGREVKGGLMLNLGITSYTAIGNTGKNYKAYPLSHPLFRHHFLVLSCLQFLKNSVKASVSHLGLREENSPALLSISKI